MTIFRVASLLTLLACITMPAGRDEVQIDNADLLRPINSYNTLAGFTSPKATLSFLPRNHSALPDVALSFGEAFYTNDPRMGKGSAQVTPISREHSLSTSRQ